MIQDSLSRPKRLAEKLTDIRKALNVSQNGLIRRLDLTDRITQAEISSFERNVRVPPIIVLLRYARAVNIAMEILVDDALDLPAEIQKKG